MSVNDDIQKKKERMLAEMRKAELEKQEAERMQNAYKAAGMNSGTPVLIVPSADLQEVINETMGSMRFSSPKIVRKMPDNRALARKTKSDEKADMYSFDVELYRHGSGKDEYVGQMWIFKNGAIACVQNESNRPWSQMSSSGINAALVREKIIEKIALDQINNEKNKSSDGCYIATAVYGSYDCPEVWVLRRYRDNILRKTAGGRAFISLYYKTSPSLVRLFGDTQWFNNFFRKKLNKKVDELKNLGVSDKRYYGK